MPANTAFHQQVNTICLFEPDELASAQFYDNFKRRYPVNPELRLMAAVLADAVATLTTDLRRCSKRQRRDFHETLRWIVERENDDWVFSFVSVCETLAIDPAYLRTGLLRKANQLRDTPAWVRRDKDRYRSARRKVVRMRVG